MRSTKEILNEMNEQLNKPISKKGIVESPVRCGMTQVYILGALLDIRDELCRLGNILERK